MQEIRCVFLRFSKRRRRNAILIFLLETLRMKFRWELWWCCLLSPHKLSPSLSRAAIDVFLFRGRASGVDETDFKIRINKLFAVVFFFPRYLAPFKTIGRASALETRKHILSMNSPANRFRANDACEMCCWTFTSTAIDEWNRYAYAIDMLFRKRRVFQSRFNYIILNEAWSLYRRTLTNSYEAQWKVRWENVE